MSYPSLDAIAEFRVLTSDYGAQYGRNGSGTVEVETKAGTMQFHGDVYEFVRNDAFNARNYFQSTVPPYKKNDFGYTIGGPVYIPGVYNQDKNKTFFFFSEEWRRDRVPDHLSTCRCHHWPSAAVQPPVRGAWATLATSVNSARADCPQNPLTHRPFSGNLVPIDPTAKPLLGMFPLPNAGTPGAFAFNDSPVQPTNWREELIRGDHNITSKLHATIRYIHDSWTRLLRLRCGRMARVIPPFKTLLLGRASAWSPA